MLWVFGAEMCWRIGWLGSLARGGMEAMRRIAGVGHLRLLSLLRTLFGSIWLIATPFEVVQGLLYNNAIVVCP